MNTWDLSPSAARRLQVELRSQVQIAPLDLAQIKTVGGVDAAYRAGWVYAAVVILSYPELEPLHQALAERRVEFPYLPGLLSFREAPGVLAALARLSQLPDVLIVDGHGWAHPRSFGLACHIGVLLDLPSVGCAKSVLVGEPETPAEAVGSRGELRQDGEIIGALLRTRHAVKPVVVSAGHRVDLDSAVDLVLTCCRGVRLPEPIRLAHQLAAEASRRAIRSPAA